MQLHLIALTVSQTIHNGGILMKLYYSPGACSLSPHIALHEAGLAHELVRVDLKARKTEKGDDFTKINPKGQVPAILVDNGELVTEGHVIVQMIADRAGGKIICTANLLISS